MKITELEGFILHLPVTDGVIADSVHALTHWGAPGVAISTDVGLVGYGYTGTHAHVASSRLIRVDQRCGSRRVRSAPDGS
jgi:hypothetical protein